MSDQMWRQAQMLVEETQQKVARQQDFVEQLERRGLDARIARRQLQVWRKL